MIGEDVRNIRKKLGLSREEFAKFLCLSNPVALSNIETDFRNTNKFAKRVLLYLDSLPKKKALELIDELQKYGD